MRRRSHQHAFFRRMSDHSNQAGMPDSNGTRGFTPKNGNRTDWPTSDTVDPRWTFLPCSPCSPWQSTPVIDQMHETLNSQRRVSDHEAFVSACPAVPCLERSKRSPHSFIRLQLLFFSSSVENMCLRPAEFEARRPLREFSDAGRC
jgi:hypothetical protein